MSNFNVKLSSAGYTDNKFHKANSFTRGNILQGLTDTGTSIQVHGSKNFEIGLGAAKPAWCRFTPGDPRHAGRLVRKNNGAVESDWTIGVYNERLTYEEVAQNITAHIENGVIAKYEPDLKTIRLTERKPGAAGNNITFEMLPPEDAPETEKPCFGTGTVAMHYGEDEGEPTTAKLIINGIEFDSADIVLLRQIIDERKNS